MKKEIGPNQTPPHQLGYTIYLYLDSIDSIHHPTRCPKGRVGLERCSGPDDESDEEDEYDEENDNSPDHAAVFGLEELRQ